MTEKLQQIIKEEVAKLSKEMQQAISSIDWIKITEELGKKYLLSESEVNDFRVETLLVLVGIRSANLYVGNLENEVGTSKNDAEKIATEVFEKIFEPIVNIMEEKIKKGLGSKKPTVEQNVNFIISGGDYSAFMDEATNQTNADTENKNKLLGTSNILETKNKLIN
ncbi:MAG TPA: hypothetical protein VGO63_02805 [Candidatus Paceibacterota bacterium]|jgi:hypothetical protein|nr:hypothetical protein [Candidatus Paceibacterota bacterium]